MARQVKVLLTDDLDGAAAAETVLFGIDGTSYEIDLSDANAGVLREIVARYASAARRVGGPRAGSVKVASGRSSSGGSDVDPVAVRVWAQQAGVDVSPRGRISGVVLEQYRASRNAPAAPVAPAEPVAVKAEKSTRRSKPPALFQEPTVDAEKSSAAKPVVKKSPARRPARAKA